LIAGIPVGETVKIKILRDGKEKTVRVKIVKRDEDKLASRGRPKEQAEEFGIRVSNLTPEMAQRLNISETSGVVVTEIQSGSKGEEADIRVGDIIKEINRRPIESVSDYQEILGQVDSGESVNLFIRRKNTGFLVVKLTK
jgi:serine protease Do